MFMEAACDGTMRRLDMVAWMDRFLVAPGWMPMPATVYEPSVGTSALMDDLGASFGKVVGAARVRTAAQLGGLALGSAGDGFVGAALRDGHVQRARALHGPGWRPSLRGDEALGDIVIALFVVDILDHRDLYAKSLAVCDVCGRVSFAGPSTPRRRCDRHPPPVKWEGEAGEAGAVQKMA